MQLTFLYLDQFLVFSVLALSLNLLTGYAGVFSAGHAGLAAIGGYAFAYLWLHHSMSFLEIVLVAMVLAAAVGALMGLVSLSLSPLWLVLFTLAVQLVLINAAGSINALGSTSGLELYSVQFAGYKFSQPTAIFPLAAVASVVTFAICWRLGESPYGRVLRGIREDSTVARALGRNVSSYKVIVFAVTAAMAGLGGVCLAILTTNANTSLFSFQLSIELIAMVIIGGMANLIGTLLGTALVVGLTPFFLFVLNLNSIKAPLWQVAAYGAALVIVVYFRPQGIVPEHAGAAWRQTLSRFRRDATSVKRGQGELGRESGQPPASHGRPQPRSAAPMPPTGQTGARTLASPAVLETDPPVSTGSVLTVRGLGKSFGGIRAVQDLDFDLQRGAITALVGPNGAGKTTVFNLLTGEITPDTGAVTLFGQDITGLKPNDVAQRGMVRSFQDVRLFGGLTVRDNVLLGVQGQPGERLPDLIMRPGRVRASERDSRVLADQWLSFVGMGYAANQVASTLGYGEQKLVSLARILATGADVLLLDEPASGIDVQWVDRMLELVAEVRELGRTICIVEHNLHVVERLADTVCFMELGRVVASGDLATLKEDRRLSEVYFGI
jgi:branched-chain amino acid transport system permease protein